MFYIPEQRVSKNIHLCNFNEVLCTQPYLDFGFIQEIQLNVDLHYRRKGNMASKSTSPASWSSWIGNWKSCFCSKGSSKAVNKRSTLLNRNIPHQ